MSGALDGLLVLSVEQAVAAPYCSAITSAPMSARCWVANGPSSTAVRSITRTPSSGPGISLPYSRVFVSLSATSSNRWRSRFTR